MDSQSWAPQALNYVSRYQQTLYQTLPSLLLLSWLFLTNDFFPSENVKVKMSHIGKLINLARDYKATSKPAGQTQIILNFSPIYLPTKEKYMAEFGKTQKLGRIPIMLFLGLEIFLVEPTEPWHNPHARRPCGCCVADDVAR